MAAVTSCENALFTTCTNLIIHLIYPTKLCIGIVFDFSWDILIFMSQEKLHTMIMQTFWGMIELYYGIVQVVNSKIQTAVMWHSKSLPLSTSHLLRPGKISFYNGSKNSRALIDLFLLSTSGQTINYGQTHQFIIYAIMTRYCSRQIEVSRIFVSLSSRVLT